ncbi:hypothetical protein L6E_26880 [Enterococcus hirae]|nr:hypothetical protein L6E_26880 [Enterococcus hirae]
MSGLIIVVLVSSITSFIVSFLMLKWHMRMFNKWIEIFFRGGNKTNKKLPV